MLNLFNIDQKLNEIKSEHSSESKTPEKSLIDDTNDDYKYVVVTKIVDKYN